MHQPSRHEAIMERAPTIGQVWVKDLAERLDVTPQTIRRDLNELCQSQMLGWVHGGGVWRSSTENMRYEQRRKGATKEKGAIGTAAVVLIPR